MTERKLRPLGRPPKHGGFSLMTRGELPGEQKKLRAYLGSFRDGLIRDLGPREEDLTAAQMALINETVTILGVVRCIEENIRETGVFKDGELDGTLSRNYLSYQNTLRLNLQALGIHTRKEGGILDLGKYIEEHDQKRAEDREAKHEK